MKDHDHRLQSYIPQCDKLLPAYGVLGIKRNTPSAKPFDKRCDRTAPQLANTATHTSPPSVSGPTPPISQAVFQSCFAETIIATLTPVNATSNSTSSPNTSGTTSHIPQWLSGCMIPGVAAGGIVIALLLFLDICFCLGARSDANATNMIIRINEIESKLKHEPWKRPGPRA